MTRKTVITDDLDGSQDATTVQFSLDGRTYEIDLSSDNRDALQSTLQRYIDAGRRMPGTPRRRNKTTSSGLNMKEVREWATAQGMTVNERGRVPAEIVEAYVSERGVVA